MDDQAQIGGFNNSPAGSGLAACEQKAPPPETPTLSWAGLEGGVL